jgi:H+/Na+-translocating ferredoxin:NAD+ oxidoreductase subunit G
MTGGHTHGTPPQAPVKTGSSARQLIQTLGGLGLLAGLIIVVAYTATKPRIEANRARVLAAAIDEVLSAPARYDTLYFVGDSLSAAPDADRSALEAVYLGYRADGTIIGFAVVGGEPGFSDVIRLIFGYDPRTSRLLGMKVLEEKETPGLGSRIETDSSFAIGFAKAESPIRGVKKGQGKQPNDVDMITGATISSRAVIRAINKTLERLGPALAAKLREQSP